MDYRGRHIAVIGMARTGLAVAEVMKDLGARVTLWDRKPEAELAKAVEAAQYAGRRVQSWD